MGIREYLFQKLVLTPENVNYLSQIVASTMAHTMKESIHNVLQDEEVAQHVTAYGDALYERYNKKFWSGIGGRQKGINYAMAEANPLTDIIDEEGNINLAEGIRAFLRGDFKNIGLGGSQTPNQAYSDRKVLKYQ